MTQPRRFWTPELEQRLRQLYPHTRTEDIAAALGLQLGQVQRKAFNLGLHKDRALIVELARERATRPGHPSQAHRWRPGQQPWNTGIKGSTGQHPNSRAWQFKPGSKPHTWVPVGSFRVKDGLLEIKYADDKGSPSRRWKAYARHVWEQAHGPLPGGSIVVFKPGRASTDPKAITLDAVELITRRENMQRNTMHRLPKELAKACQLRGALNRQINRLTRQAEKDHA